MDTDSVEIIDDGAFGTYNFQPTIELTLRNLKVSYLKANHFLGLAALRELTLVDMPVQTIQANLLGPIRDSLNRLIINGLQEIYLQNLTGCCSALPVLETLAISNTKVDVIENDSLSQLEAIKWLNITNCELKSIEMDAFDHILKTILTINLMENQLTTIDGNLFKCFVGSALVKVLLHDNPWNCELITSETIEFIYANWDTFDDIEMCYFESSETPDYTATDDVPELTTEPNDPGSAMSRNAEVWHFIVCLVVIICYQFSNV